MTDAQFQSTLGSSVISSRNHGLLRGVAMKDNLSVLQIYAKHKNEVNPSLKKALSETADPPATPDKIHKYASDEDDDSEEVLLTKSIAINKKSTSKAPAYGRQNTAPATFSSTGISDKTYTWEWPLGNPVIKNGEDQFEVRLKVRPFKPNEVSVSIIDLSDITVLEYGIGFQVYLSGSELVIHCANMGSDSGSIGQIFRAYMLPLNVNPRSAEFTMTRSGYIRVCIHKELPLTMAVAFAEGVEPS